MQQPTAQASMIQEPIAQDAELQRPKRKRCERNRKRSQRRQIFCPEHGVHLDSASKKYYLFADQPGQLQIRGIGRVTSRLLIEQYTTIPLNGEWLECFWCKECDCTQWYLVTKTGDRSYFLSLAPTELWQQVAGVLSVDGNPSVGEFTRRHSRAHGRAQVRDFKFM